MDTIIASIQQVVAALTRPNSFEPAPPPSGYRDFASIEKSIKLILEFLRKHTPNSNFENNVSSQNDLHLLKSLRDVSLMACAWYQRPYPQYKFKPSVLEALGRQFHELIYSDCLAALFNEAVMGKFAQELFGKMLALSYEGRSISLESIRSLVISRREVRLQSINKDLAGSEIGGRRIDILVSLGRYFLVIENKMFTSESYNQLPDYLNAVRSIEGSIVQGFLISPKGKQSDDTSSVSVSYSEFFDLIFSLSSFLPEQDLARSVFDFVCNEIYENFVKTDIESIKRTQKFWVDKNQERELNAV